jgi:hypothetical protein
LDYPWRGRVPPFLAADALPIQLWQPCQEMALYGTLRAYVKYIAGAHESHPSIAV